MKMHIRIIALRRLFVLTAALFLTATIASAATPWKFARAYISKRWDNAEFLKQPVIDLSGGTIELVITGNIPSICTNGNEKLLIRWRIDRDITLLNPNETFGAKLEMRMTGASGDCNGGLSGRTQAVVTAGMSGGPNWGDIVGKRLDDDRFQNKSFNQMANGGQGGPNTVDSVIAVNSNEPYVDRPAAGFIVYIGGPGGDIRILYAYEPSGAGGSGNACGYTLGSGILGKWLQTGGENGFLGCARSNENEAGRSPKGTTGRYALFNDGVIIWHRDGTNAGRSFELHGCIASLYQQMGGTNSWLGFPVSDEYSVNGGRQSNFEGGYIFWDEKTRQCQAYKYTYETEGGTNTSLPDLAGTWYFQGNSTRPATIRQSGNVLTFINEKGDSTRGHFESSDVVVADNWQGGLRGRLNQNRTRIDWANGSFWQR